MLEALRHDLRAGTRDGLTRAARRAYLLALALLAIPGLVFGTLLLLTRPVPTPPPAFLGLLGLSLGLALLALYFARKAAHRTDWPARQAALTGAIQAATAPGVAFLLGCTALNQPQYLLAFWVLALALHALVWAQLPGWVRAPEQSENLSST